MKTNMYSHKCIQMREIAGCYRDSVRYVLEWVGLDRSALRFWMGMYGVNKEIFFELNDSGRRGHMTKNYLKRFRLDVRKYAFSNRWWLEFVKALSFTHELFSFPFFFYRSTGLSSRAEDGHQGSRSTRHMVNSSQPKIVWRVDRRLKHRVVFRRFGRR